MANICEIQQSPKYQRMKECASTSDIKSLNIVSLYYNNRYGELPEIDEVSFLDSTKLLEKGLKIQGKTTKYTTLQNLYSYTETSSIEEATIQLNTILHPDLDITLTQVGNNVLIDSKVRPTQADGLPTNIMNINIQSEAHKKLIFQDMLYELSNKLGINFKYITNEELNSEKWINLVGDAKLINAFVYNGDIYINTDNASIDAPLHEISHILLGNVRFINPTLYVNLLEEISKIPNIQKEFHKYLDRTNQDILEEILVDEFSKYITNIPSLFDSISISKKHKINYYMQRCLDTMIHGNYSVKNLKTTTLGDETLTTLASKLHSNMVSNNRQSSIDISAIHRIVNNEKSKLLKSGDLIEQC